MEPTFCNIPTQIAEPVIPFSWYEILGKILRVSTKIFKFITMLKHSMDDSQTLAWQPLMKMMPS